METLNREDYIEPRVSYIMSHIRSKNTRPEMIVRRFLFSRGFRYRLHSKLLPGKPDIVLKKFKSVIFVNGCFWHGHDCKYFSIPKTRTDWWINKINNNKNRDIQNQKTLASMGWKILVIFECQLRRGIAEENLINLVSQIKNYDGLPY